MAPSSHEKPACSSMVSPFGSVPAFLGQNCRGGVVGNVGGDCETYPVHRPSNDLQTWTDQSAHPCRTSKLYKERLQTLGQEARPDLALKFSGSVRNRRTPASGSAWGNQYEVSQACAFASQHRTDLRRKYPLR